MKAKSLKAGFVLMRALLIFADFSIAAVTDEPRVRNLGPRISKEFWEI